MIQRWFFPSWCGDFRLERTGERTCRLVVTDPTPAEVQQLGAFLKRARKREWILGIEGVSARGESRLDLAVDLPAAAGALGGLKLPKQGVLTAVRSAEGRLVAVTEDQAEAATAAEAAPAAAEAATVRRPTLCCPAPVPGPEVRASEVLRAFCTPRQWAQWLAEGFLTCIGNLSGHRYRIAHRDSELARRQGKITWDVTAGHVIHCYDWSVPPPEEVLSVKLCLEHREAWIRNFSGNLSGHGPWFRHPFMSDLEQRSDGLASAAAVRSIGSAARQGLLAPLFA